MGVRYRKVTCESYLCTLTDAEYEDIVFHLSLFSFINFWSAMTVLRAMKHGSWELSVACMREGELKTLGVAEAVLCKQAEEDEGPLVFTCQNAEISHGAKIVFPT